MKNNKHKNLRKMATRVKEKLPSDGRFPLRLIDSATVFRDAVAMIGRETHIACDLEADSMYHFREKVCLLQLATREHLFIIDPLQIADLAPLGTVFADRSIRKVFHGADYDMRSLYRDFGIQVRSLFDTQIACRFLGMSETGLDTVLQHRFDLKLNKKYQKKDWSRRPLPEEMMAYAAADVTYLIPLADQLEAELAALGRLAWVEEESRLLSRVRPATDTDEPLFLRFKGAGRFRPRGLAVLEALLQCRRRIAERKDRPLFKIISNTALLEIAKARPVSNRRLAGLNVLSAKQLDMYGADLVEAVQAALALPEAALPVYPRKKPPRMKPEVPKRVRALRSWRDKRAAALGIDPSLLLSKAQLTAIAAGNPKHPDALAAIDDLRDWQRSEFGDAIIDILRTTR